MTNAPDTPVELAAVERTAETVSAQLAQEGAILTPNDSRTEAFLVGHLVWLSPERIFCFAANGNDPKRDGHLLLFDVAMEKPSEITFWRKTRVVARLTSINACGRVDADDFRAAWRVWQQRRPLCQQLIGASLSRHVTVGGQR